jgi:hypothetical protein
LIRVTDLESHPTSADQGRCRGSVGEYGKWLTCAEGDSGDNGIAPEQDAFFIRSPSQIREPSATRMENTGSPLSAPEDGTNDGTNVWLGEPQSSLLEPPVNWRRWYKKYPREVTNAAT